MKGKKKNLWLYVFIAALILAAYLLRFIGNSGIYVQQAGLIRSFIYISIFIAWGFSVRNRIIQSQVRRYMTAIASLMVFWFLVRTLKFHFVPSEPYPTVTRYLWYSYYLAMLFIPMFAVFVSMSIGKPENYQLPKKTMLLYIPTTILFLSVITNDLHQLVFTFPADAAVWTDSDNGYTIGYFLIVGWLFFCVLTMLYEFWRKRRIESSRRLILIPCIPIVVLIVYMGFYYSGEEWLRFVFGDMTVMTCVLYAACLELCIRLGFIQVNTRYAELFSNAADMPAQITDKNYTVRYASKDAQPIPEKQMRAAEAKPVMLAAGKRLHNMPIHGGHAIWTEDMSELLTLREKLEDTKEELKDRNGLLQYEYEREKEHKVVEEQNRLYDLLQRGTQIQIDKINRLIIWYQKSSDSEEKKRILPQIAVLGSFVKRRKDMILCIDSTPTIPENKLIGALGESYRSLALLNVQGRYFVNTGKDYLDGQILALAYDFFEDTVEASLDTLRSINVRVSSVGGNLRISILADGDGDFSVLRDKYPSVSVCRDADGVQLVLPLEGGGMA